MQLRSIAACMMAGGTLLAFAQDASPRKPFGAEDTVTIHIRLLNGKTGKPLPQQNIFLERSAMHLMSHAEEHDIVTNDEGLAEATVAKHGIVLNPIVMDYKSCTPRTHQDGEKEKSERFSVAQIVSSGVVAQNTCGKATRTPAPGELVLYYRNMNVLERMTD